MAFDPDEYLAGAEGGGPAGAGVAEFNPDEYLAGDKPATFDPDQYLQQTETARYGAPLTPEQRAAIAIQGPPVLPEGAQVDFLGNIQGLPPQPGPIPDYLTQQAIEQGIGQGVDLGAIADPVTGLRAQMKAEHLPQQQPKPEYPSHFVDTPEARQRFAEEMTGAIESLGPPIEAWMKPAIEFKRPVGQLPAWQDQPTLGGKLAAGQLQALGAVANLPADLLNFALTPAGAAVGGVAEIGPLSRRAVALGFSADQIRQGMQSDNLQDQVALALGAGLGAYGGLHVTPYEAPAQRTLRAGGTDLQWNPTEQKWVNMAAGKRALEPIPLSLPEVIDAERFAGEHWAQAEPPPVPPELQGVASETARVSTGETPAKAKDAAVRMPDGKVFTGLMHSDAVIKAANAGYSHTDMTKAVHGFVDADNVFFTLPPEPPPGGAPSVAVDKAAENLPPTQSAPANAGDVVKIRPEQAVVRPDLMQYKAALDPATGRTQEHGETIVGPWDPFKAGNLTLWEPIDPAAHGLTGEQKYIVANGHGRFYEINKQKVPEFNAQILKESDGVSATDARIQAAEANIADGKGSIFDAANFIRGQAETEGADAALERARQIGARGRKAATIALHSAPDLYASFINERITPDQAAAIAEAAPGNEGWQRVGIRKAIEEKWDQAKLYNFLQPLASGKGRTPEPRMAQGGLFGDEDPAIKAMDEASDRAGALQREIGESINAVQGAAKRPERAKAMGVDVTDPAAIQAKLIELRALRERARQWSLDPQIFDIIYNRPEVSAPDALAELTRPKEEAGPTSAPDYTVENQSLDPATRRKGPGVTIFDGPTNDPHGVVEARKLKSGELEIYHAFVKPELRGTGRGVGLFQKLMESAGDSPVVTDNSVSESAARAIEALRRRGYAVEKDPRAKLTDVSLEEKQWITPDQSPVFKIERPPELTRAKEGEGPRVAEAPWVEPSAPAGVRAAARVREEPGLPPRAGPADPEETNALRMFSGGEPTRLQTTEELKADDRLLGVDPDTQAILDQPKYWFSAEHDTVNDLFATRGDAEAHIKTTAHGGEYIVQREVGKSDRVIYRRAHSIASKHAEDVVKYIPRGSNLTGEPLRLALERGRAAELRWQKGEVRARAEAAAETGALPGESQALGTYGTDLEATAQSLYGRRYRDLNADQQEQVRYQTHVEGGRVREEEAGAPEVRVATPREKQIAKMVTNLMRGGMSFEDALARSMMGKENVRTDLIRSIAEAPLRKQADLFGGGQDPFNLVGETMKPSADGPDLGQGDLPAEKRPVQQELFSEAPTSLGGGPPPEPVIPDPADDPHFTALPVDLPEAVRFNDQLLGVGITLVRKLKALGGRAAGVFRFTRGQEGKGRIVMRADMADLLSPEEKQALLDEAQAYAENLGRNAREIKEIAAERYKYLLDQAYEEAKKGPSTRALKVIWHEIGHAADWFGANWYKLMGSTNKTLERGNIFGHIAGLFDYLKEVIALDPFKPEGKPITPRERARMREKALEEMRRQIGPIQEIVETITQEEPELRVVGIQPEDVLSLINSNAARTELPDLYRWFAEQGADVKKEIIKAAMRGMLDARLAAMGRSEVVGMRRVERTVRRTVGREPTQEEVNAKFKELFETELKRRNLGELNTVIAELRSAIAWWRGTDVIEPYFDNPKEMYAEAFSIFMNNPQALARRAPTYTRLLWNYMEARPEVSDIYRALQNEIKSGQVKDRTEQIMTDGWAEADKRSIKAAQERATSMAPSRADFLDNVVYHIDRRMGPVYRAGKGAAGEGALRAAIGNFLYRQTTHEAILNRINREIAHELLKNNLDWTDLARVMFYNRIYQERFAKFNPGGVDARRAADRLQNMRDTLGPQRMAALIKAQSDLRRIYQDMVLGPMKEERMWNKELQDFIDHNIYYATFDVLQDGKDGIEALLHNTQGGHVGPHIYRQIGTLKEISNPATATVLKMLSLSSATLRNQVKRLTIQALHENQLFPNEKVMEAKTRWNDALKRREYVPIENPNVGTLVYMRDGVPQAFYVPRVIADALNHSGGIENHVFRAAVNATGWLKATYTQLNYGFWPFNFLRDTVGWNMQMPGATPVDWLREIGPGLKAARATVKGRANPSADAALARRMVISRADPRGIWSAVDDAYEIQLASYGLNPVAWTKEGNGVNRLVKLWNSYRELGQTVERANKIAGMNYLDRKFPNMPEWKKAEIVRERAGSPDFLQRGAANPQIDFFWMFYNPWKEGIRSVARAARENPYSFTAKSSVGIVAPSVLMTLAAAGIFGNGMKRMYRSVGDYDLSNFFVIPLGWADDEQTKVAYIRLPLWEPARILHSALWQFTTGRSAGTVATWGGTLPSMNSLLGVAGMYWMYEVHGKNPYDFFRGKNVLDDNTFKAQGWPAQRELLKQAWNMLGGSIFYRFQNKVIDTPPTTRVEKFLQLPGVSNLIGRWIKVSDRGIGDIDQHLIAQDDKYRANVRLGVTEIERKLLNGEGLIESERRLLREPYAQQYFMDTWKGHARNINVPIYKRLEGKTPQQKLMILQQNP